MASTDLPPIMLDHLYSMDDNLKAGGPLLLLENAHENPVVGDEPPSETAPVVEPVSISRCCIEKGLFPAVPLFFQYPCGISKGWSEWVDRELRNPSTCAILRRAQVLDAIFLSKLWDIHIEAKMLRHVVRRRSRSRGVRVPGGSGKIATPVSSKRKREEEKKVSEKQTASKPKRFIPKVAPSGPPRTKEATPPKHPQPSEPAASGSRAAIRNNTSTTPTAPSHAQPFLRASGPSPPTLLPTSSTRQCECRGKHPGPPLPPPGMPAVECPHNMSWPEWEESFTAFMAFFDSGAQVLRSADELLPLYHRFNGYARFRGIFVYPETVASLEKFLDKHGDFMDMTGITSSFSRCTAFRTLGLVLHGIDTAQLLDITDHRLLCWRDAVCEAMTLGFRAEPLLNLVWDLARAAFGAQAVHNMKSHPSPDAIRAAAEALVFKQRELENQHRELCGLLSAQGVSSDGADCVMEAVTRSSHEASPFFSSHP
ncbi:unnamed protein product [Prunus brigantina]